MSELAVALAELLGATEAVLHELESQPDAGVDLATLDHVDGLRERAFERLQESVSVAMRGDPAPDPESAALLAEAHKLSHEVLTRLRTSQTEIVEERRALLATRAGMRRSAEKDPPRFVTQRV